MVITVAGIDSFVSTNNLGIQAISDGLLWRLKKIFPKARLIRHLKNYRINRDIWKMAEKVDGQPERYEEYFSEFFKAFKYSHPDRITDIVQSDQLIICGDGIIADIFPQWCLVLAAEAGVAIENGIPFVSLDQSVNTKSTSLAGYAVKNIFLKAPISVREPYSLQLLKEQFNAHKVDLSIDTAFLVDPLSLEEIGLYSRWLNELKRLYRFDDFLVFSVRGKRPPSQPIDAKSWATVLSKLSQTFDVPILFASTCPMEDFPLAREIRSHFSGFIMPDELIDSGKYNYRFMVYLLKQAVMNISDRYHQNVFSLLSNTPFIPVEGNTNKSHSLIEMVKYPIGLLPILTHDHLGLYEEKIHELSLRYRLIKDFLENEKQIELFDNYEAFLT
jgi:polysaccharide pyruvyl transferase WcaK-like protein